MKNIDKTILMNTVDHQLIADSWDLVRNCQEQNTSLFGKCETLRIGSPAWVELTKAARWNSVVIEKALKTINVAHDRIEKRG